MALTGIMSKQRKNKVHAGERGVQEPKLSEGELQEILNRICEDINFKVLCTDMDVRCRDDRVLFIEGVAVTSFAERMEIKEEKRPSLWGRMMKCLLRG